MSTLKELERIVDFVNARIRLLEGRQERSNRLQSIMDDGLRLEELNKIRSKLAGALHRAKLGQFMG